MAKAGKLIIGDKATYTYDFGVSFPVKKIKRKWEYLKVFTPNKMR